MAKNPGVVYADIEASEPTDHSIDHALDLSLVPDVTANEKRIAAECLELARSLFTTSFIAVDERNIGSGLRQRERARAPDASGRAGHQRLAAAQVEER
jgi:hypothetical protein